MEKTNEVKEHYNIQEACEAQKQYVMNYAKNHPQDIFADMFAKGEGFAPKSGCCWRCSRNIYAEATINGRISKGYSVERASKEMITGCPHCYASFVD